MEKKPRQGSPSRAESQAPLFPTDDPLPKASLRRPSAKAQKRELRKQAREVHEKDWLAPAGSVQEKQFLKRLAKLKENQKDLDLIYKSINNPNGSVDRNSLWWQTAKKSVLGPVVYETAMERHNKLNDKEWLVACFTAQGMKQEEIGKLIHMSKSTVDNIMRSLKDKIIQELKCDIKIDDRVQIARWFLGL